MKHFSSLATVETPADRRGGFSLRQVFAFFVLTVFLLQGFLIQTHIHGLPDAELPSAGVAVTAPAGPDEHLDEALCPLCQETIRAGAFLLPSAFAALFPMLAATTIPPALGAAVAAAPLSHHWRVRAPPYR